MPLLNPHETTSGLMPLLNPRRPPPSYRHDVPQPQLSDGRHPAGRRLLLGEDGRPCQGLQTFQFARHRAVVLERLPEEVQSWSSFDWTIYCSWKWDMNGCIVYIMDIDWCWRIWKDIAEQALLEYHGILRCPVSSVSAAQFAHILGGHVETTTSFSEETRKPLMFSTTAVA
jgi:hypothetical protein